MTEFLKWLAAPANRSAIMEDIMFAGQGSEKIERKFGENLEKKSQLKIAGSVN
jgi:hypothetical protein